MLKLVAFLFVLSPSTLLAVETCNKFFSTSTFEQNAQSHVWISMDRGFSVGFSEMPSEIVQENTISLYIAPTFKGLGQYQNLMKPGGIVLRLKMKLKQFHESRLSLFKLQKIVYENQNYELSIRKTNYSIERVILKKKGVFGLRTTVLDIYDTIYGAYIDDS